MSIDTQAAFARSLALRVDVVPHQLDTLRHEAIQVRGLNLERVVGGGAVVARVTPPQVVHNHVKDVWPGRPGLAGTGARDLACRQCKRHRHRPAC